MGRENDRRARIAQREDLVLEQIGIDRIETAERLVENQQFGLVQHRDDELYLLGHPLAQFLDLLVPPAGNAELLEPPLQPERGLALGKPLELGEIERLFADLHLLIQPPFLGQIADAADVLRRETAAAEQNAAFVRSRDAVDDTDQRRLAGAVGTEQAVNGPPGNRERHVVQRGMRRIPLRHVLDT